MISQCPQCKGNLSFNPEQQTKLEQALQALESGKLLSLKCPLCQQAIKLDKQGAAIVSENGVNPPSPPDLEWLASGQFKAEEKVEDVPMALLLLDSAEQSVAISEALKSVGYLIVTAESVEDALERMRFTNFACVIYDPDLHGGLNDSSFHRFMCRMPMERRRYIFYILVGSSLNTLYNLEALAYSANLVVNYSDVASLELILRKSIPEYEELFGPLIEEISAYGVR